MRIRNDASWLLGLLVLSLTGCSLFGGGDGGGGGSDTSSCSQAASSDDDDDDDDAGPPEREPTVEEADLYQLDGNALYVYSYSKGLAVLDVTSSSAPVLLGEVALTGPAGELYADAGRVTLVLEGTTGSSEQIFGPADSYAFGEIVTIDATTMPPSITSRTSLTGFPVASRRIGDRLFVVTTDGNDDERSWVMEIDLANPADPTLSDILELEGGAREIHLGDDLVLYVAQPFWGASYEPMTRVRIVDLDDPQEGVVERGEVTVTGAPQGRFHMDEDGTHFRIVTYDEWYAASILHVIDVEDRAAPFVAGTLGDIAYGERLYATRFDGKRAYIVTFRQTDPLWVVDLSVATAPVIVAGLVVPGWSDYVFPRGDRLLAVGRGQNGGVGLTLFDVANAQAPATLAQLEFGSWGASSEANFDFRGIGVLEAGALSASPLVALPVNGSTWDYSTSASACANELHLVSIEGTTLIPRGVLPSEAMVRRSLAIGGKLFAISDLSVSSVDVADLDAPQVLASIDVGDAALLQPQCPYISFDGGGEGGGWDDMGCGGGCSVSPVPGSTSVAIGAILLAASGIVLLRRRR